MIEAKKYMVTDIYIVGSGGLGREVADTIAQLPNYKIKGFIDTSFKPGSVVNGIEVLGPNEDLMGISGKVNAVLAVASSSARRRVVEYFGASVTWCNIIHPTAIVSPFATLGAGLIVQAYCVLAANCKIGDFVVMNAHSGAGHDAEVGAYASIMSYCDVAGNASLGSDSFMGSGAKVIPSVNVGCGSYLCAGAVVMRDVKDAEKVIGNPGRVVGTV